MKPPMRPVALATQQYYGASYRRLSNRNRDFRQHPSEHHTRPCLTPSSIGWRYSFLRGTSIEVEWPLWEACRWHESKSGAGGVVPRVPRHEGRYAMLHGCCCHLTQATILLPRTSCYRKKLQSKDSWLDCDRQVTTPRQRKGGLPTKTPTRRDEAGQAICSPHTWSLDRCGMMPGIHKAMLGKENMPARTGI